MHAGRVLCVFSIALLFAAPASAQWTVHTQKEKGGAWEIKPSSPQRAMHDAEARCGRTGNGVPLLYAAKAVSPSGEETVFQCGTTRAAPKVTAPAAPQTTARSSGAAADAFPKVDVGAQMRVPTQKHTTIPVAASPALDVVGLRLGASPAAADKAVRAHMTVGWIYGRGDTRATVTAYKSMKAYVAADLSEVILIYFEPSITEGKIVAVRRSSMIGQNVAASAVEGALVQRYGKPAVAKNGNWVWGNPSGCSASGVGSLSLRDLKRLDGPERSDKVFQQVIANASDLAIYHQAVKPERYASCGPVLHVLLRRNNGVMTTLVDQKLAMVPVAVESNNAAITF